MSPAAEVPTKTTAQEESARKPETSSPREDRGQMLMLSPHGIVPSPFNTRLTRNAQADNELLQGVKVHGVIEPVLVRPQVFLPIHAQLLKERNIKTHHKPGQEVHELIAGQRRWEAALRAGKDSVRAVVQQLSDEKAKELQVIENDQREDLDPIDRASGYANLYQEYLKTMKPADAIALLKDKLGKEKRTVYNVMSLVNLGADAQKELRSGRLSASHGYLIAHLPPEVQKRVLHCCSNYNGYFSVRDMQNYIQFNVYLPLDGAPFAKDDAKLLPEAGACTTCPKNTAVTPELASENDKHAKCTDQVCYGKKQSALLVQIEKAPDIVRISDDYQAKPTKNNDFITRDRWTEVKPKSCKSAVKATIIDGRRKAHQITICSNQSCSIHNPSSRRTVSSMPASRPSAANAKAEKKSAEQRKVNAAIEQDIRYEILKQIAGKAKLNRTTLNELAIEAMMTFSGWNDVGSWGKHIGLPEQSSLYSSYDKSRSTLAKYVPKLKDGQLSALLIVVILDADCGDFLDVTEYSKPAEKSDHLKKLLKPYKLNLAKIRKQVTQSHKLSVASPSAKTPAKKAS